MNIGLEAQANPEAATRDSGLLDRLTFEHLFYGIILLAGLITRFIDLGKIPLAPVEASQALSVWRAWQAGATTEVIHSPAYFNLTSPLTQLLGFGDGIMRLIPAIFGSALIVLPWWLRKFTGRIGSLVAALLIAVSPLFVISSRTAGGVAIAFFAATLVIICWLNFQDSNREKWFFGMSAAMGLGLTSDPVFYSVIAAFSVAWLIQWFLGPTLFVNAFGLKRPLRLPDSRTFRRGVVVFAAVFLLTAAGLLLKIEGIGASARILSDWLSAFFAPASLQQWLRPITAFIRYELLVVGFGGAAIVWATWRGKSFPMLLVYWFLAGMLLLFIQPGLLENALVLSVGGILLAGTLVDEVLQEKSGVIKWITAIGVFFAGSVIYLNLSRFARLQFSQIPLDIRTRSYHLLLIAIVVIAALLAFIALWSSFRRAALQGFVIGALALFVGFSWSTAIWLATEAAGDSREPWIVQATDDDIRILARTIQQVSWQVKGSEQDLDILSTIEDPSLAWYLKDMRELTLGGSLASTTESSSIVTEMERETQLANDYVGFDLAYSRPETAYSPDSSQLLHWWLFHENSLPIDEHRLIFWLRSDLAGIEK